LRLRVVAGHDAFMQRWVWLIVSAAVLSWPSLWGVSPAKAQSAAPVVYTIPIAGTIDLGLAPFLARTVREAQAAGAAAVVLDINTFGGRVDAAVAMRDTLLNSPVRTIAFVNQRAISAGALITLASETVVMTRGGTVGAATPVVGGGTGQPEKADEKTVSYMRSEFRATAEARKRSPEIAEAMVDADVAIDGLIEAGKLLTLTSSQAIEHHIADYTADTLSEALAAVGITGAEVRTVEQTWAESVVRFLTDPIVSSLLMTVGLIGLLVEIRTPGFGLPGILGVLSLGCFFWGHWLVQLAGWEELLLVAVGVVLLLVEIFVTPGFTIAGVAGILSLVGGLGLALVGSGSTFNTFVSALGQVAISILLALALSFVLLQFLPRLPFGRRLVLETDMEAGDGYVSSPETDRRWLGRTGTAASALRPAGIASIDGARIDVVSDGGFIDAGTPIEVTRVDGNRIVVRPVTTRQESADV
jgi:membrane-bound serine protease (ClpP class)